MVIVSWITFNNDDQNFGAIRTIRVLKPLRTISRFQFLKKIVNSIISSFSLTGDIAIIMIYYVVVFSITGQQLFKGALKKSCFYIDNGFNNYLYDSQLLLCNNNNDCPEGQLCGKQIQNPYDGFLNFDTFFWSIVQVFQSCTLVGWTSIMQSLQQTVNYWVWIYSFALSFIGAFVIINLLLALVTIGFQQTGQKQNSQKEISDKFDLTICQQLQLIKKKNHNYKKNLLKKFQSLSQQKASKIQQDLFSKLNQKIKIMKSNTLKNFQKLQNFKKVNNFYQKSKNQVMNLDPNIIITSNNEEDKLVNENTQIENDQHQKKSKLKQSQRQKIQIQKNINQEIDQYVENNIADNLISNFSRDMNHQSILDINDENKKQSDEENEQDHDNIKDQLNQEILTNNKKQLSLNQSSTQLIDMDLQKALEINQTKLEYLNILTKKSTQLTVRIDEQVQPNIKQREDVLKLQAQQEQDQIFQLKNALKTIYLRSNYVSKKYNKQKNEKKLENYYKFKDSIYANEIRDYQLNKYKGLNFNNQNINCKYYNLKNNFFDQKQPIKKKPSFKKQKSYQFENINGNEYLIKQNLSRLDQVNQINWLNSQFFLNIQMEIINFAKSGKYIQNVLFSGYYIQNVDSKNQVAYNALQQRNQKMLQSLNYIPQNYLLSNSNNIFYEIQRKCILLINNQNFDNYIIFVVFCNSIVMIIEIYQEQQQQFIFEINVFFNLNFMLELIIKNIALSPKIYIKNKMNVMDSFIVIFSIFDYAQEYSTNLKALRGFKILKSLKVVKISRFMRSLKYVQTIILVIQDCFNGFASIILLILIFLTIFALLGKQLFYDENYVEIDHSKNWSSTYNAYMNVFQILTLDSWNMIQYQILNSNVNKFLSMIYIYFWIFIGNFVLLNLFLAQLLQGFLSNKEQFKYNEDDDFDLELNHNYLNKIKNTKLIDKVETDQETIKFKSQYSFCYQSIQESYTQHSLMLFSKTNKIRLICSYLNNNKNFEYFVLVVIFLSSIQLVLGTYVKNNNQDDLFVTIINKYLNNIVLLVFSLELLIKTIAQGLILQKESYLRNYWQQMDFIIIMTCIIDEFLNQGNLSFLKILRILKCLRPLRLISTMKSLRILVSCLIKSILGILNVIYVVIMLWFVFILLFGFQLKDYLGYCSKIQDSNFPYPPYKIGIEDCQKLNGQWKTYDFNFENLGQSFISLFILSTLDGWSYYVTQGIDSASQETGPIFQNNQSIIFLYIAFIVFGSFFSVNLFIGMMSLQFDDALNEERNKLLTADQERWIQIQYFLQNDRIDVSSFQRSNNKIRKFFLKILRNPKYEIAVMIIVVASVIILMIDNDDLQKQHKVILYYSNTIFAIFFILEVILKILVLGVKPFFQSNWNRMDFYIATSSVIEFIIFDIVQFSSDQTNFSSVLRILRILRVQRVLKIIKNFQSLQKLLITLQFSLPAIINATSLLFLFYFIFSIIGCYLFSKIDFLDQNFQTIMIKEDQLIGVDKSIGFQNFMKSFLTLYRQSTGEDWAKIMFDLTRTPEDGCIGVSTCGNKNNQIFFIVFILVQSYIMINLFILILMQNLEENYINIENAISQYMDQSEIFKEKWVEFCDQNDFNYIADKNLIEFYANLPLPIGLLQENQIEDKQLLQNMKQEKKIQAALLIMKMNIKCNQYGLIYYNRVLFEFFKNALCTKKNIITSKTLDYIKLQIQNQEKQTVIQIIKQEEEHEEQLLYKQQNRSQQQIQSFNPMLTILYQCMVLKSWAKFTERFNEKLKQNNEANFSISTINEEDYLDKKIRQSYFLQFLAEVQKDTLTFIRNYEYIDKSSINKYWRMLNDNISKIISLNNTSGFNQELSNNQNQQKLLMQSETFQTKFQSQMHQNNKSFEIIHKIKESFDIIDEVPDAQQLNFTFIDKQNDKIKNNNNEQIINENHQIININDDNTTIINNVENIEDFGKDLINEIKQEQNSVQQEDNYIIFYDNEKKSKKQKLQQIKIQKKH